MPTYDGFIAFSLSILIRTVSVSSYLQMRWRRVIMAEFMTVAIYCKYIDTIYIASQTKMKQLGKIKCEEKEKNATCVDV
jgi:hypothetical protein